jgi:hypothetical protein
MEILKYNKYNKYDYGIIFLIALLVFGNIGGAYQPIRLVAILFSLNVLNRIIKKHISKKQKFVFCFFVFWYAYSIFSLLWTSDQIQASKELIYYYGHFSLFFLIVFWSEKANDPLRSIIYGWCLFFLLTLPIALIEILTDQHLTYSLLQADTLINPGHGLVAHQKFASVTFGNYNGYVTALVFTLPFLFANLLSNKKFKIQCFGWILVFLCFYILLINASRGGIICATIVLIVFMLYYKKSSFNFKKILAIVILTFICFSLYYFFGSIFEQFSNRLVNRTSIFEDRSRVVLIQRSLQLFYESYFMGTGVGSIIASMLNVSPLGIVIPHNLFLEILVQYGIFIFGAFLILLIKLFFLSLNASSSSSRFILCSGLLSLLPASVINSGYLLMPVLWVFFASLFVLATNLNLYEKN